MIEELKKAYGELSLSQKRNELNKEIMALLLLVNYEGKLYNYDSNKKMSEDEFLIETYIQIFELKMQLIELIEKNRN